MEFNGKDEIQALDSLGRWEPARVLEVNGDGTYEVAFLGWGKDYDAILPKECVRAAIHPFYQEIGTIRSRTRRGTPRESVYLSFLRGLVAGTVVDFDLENEIVAAEVCVVDRFNRSVTANINGEKKVIHASKIRIPALPTVKSRTTLSRKRKKVDNIPQISSVTQTNCSQSHTLEKDVDSFLRVLSKDGDVITTGDTVQLTLSGHPVSVGLLGLSRDDQADQKNFVAKGFLFGDNDVKLQVPVKRLQKASTTITPTACEKKLMKSAFKEAMQYSLEKSKVNFQYRLQVRRTQIGRHLLNEINLALKSKCNCRLVSFGVCSLDTDLEIVGIDPLKQENSEFSYRKGNLASLDSLMGDRWDIEQQDGRASFVTSVIFKLNCRDVMTARVLTAFSWIDILASDNYRRDLKESCSM